MQLIKSKEARERLQTFGHIIAGVVVLLHGATEFEEYQVAFGIFYILFGIAFISLALMHRRLEHRFPDISTYFFFIEGLILFLTAFKYIHEHKQYLQYAYFLSGIIYFVVGYLFRKRKSGKMKA